MQLTQDCNDSCCADHVGNDAYAWDWANGSGFTVVAARGGTVTHLKINSNSGCATKACSTDANYLVIDHGDGTQSTYLHLAGGTLAASVTCGGHVARGQPLAHAGTTGHSTGVHLHFQVNTVDPAAPTCECGADGTGCAVDAVPWSHFWVSAAHPSLAIPFDEWSSASTCADRRMAMPASLNAAP
jgi:murein DD-endopeptidase MepM/ murein hydrolase activator NlpD